MSTQKKILILFGVFLLIICLLFSTNILKFDLLNFKSADNVSFIKNDSINSTNIDFPLQGKWYLESDTSYQYIFVEHSMVNGELEGRIDIVDQNEINENLRFNFYPPNKIKISDPLDDFPPYEFEYQLSENKEKVDFTYLSEHSKGFVSRYIRNIPQTTMAKIDFSGTWSNEGDVTATSRLTIEMDQKRDEIEGTIAYIAWDKDGEDSIKSGLFSIIGTIKNNIAQITLYDGNGRVHIQGFLILENEIMRFGVEKSSPFFPKEMNVWKQ